MVVTDDFGCLNMVVSYDFWCRNMFVNDDFWCRNMVITDDFGCCNMVVMTTLVVVRCRNLQHFDDSLFVTWSQVVTFVLRVVTMS